MQYRMVSQKCFDKMLSDFLKFYFLYKKQGVERILREKKNNCIYSSQNFSKFLPRRYRHRDSSKKIVGGEKWILKIWFLSEQTNFLFISDIFAKILFFEAHVLVLKISFWNPCFKIIWRFKGLIVFSGPVPVLVMSLVFIASVFILHIWGKYSRGHWRIDFFICLATKRWSEKVIGLFFHFTCHQKN